MKVFITKDVRRLESAVYFDVWAWEGNTRLLHTAMSAGTAEAWAAEQGIPSSLAITARGWV